MTEKNKRIDRGVVSDKMRKRYQVPRSAQQDNNVFNDDRTKRKVYSHYTGMVVSDKKPETYKIRNIAVEKIKTETKEAIEKRMFGGKRGTKA
jgi:hypothetical protein